uniref:Variant surface glycoprotein 1125.1345 n=1 Tax=Trypanosoma brucei TaxID=5691 RepID=A0A1J0R6W3_9TRYP|nr:variant surface glycoprotein 1125.1345 [Trypanosoma brucei]
MTSISASTSTLAITLFIVSSAVHAQKGVKHNACANECQCKARLQTRLQHYRDIVQRGQQRQGDNVLRYGKIVLGLIRGDAMLKKRLIPVVAAAGSQIHAYQAALTKLQPLLNAAEFKVAAAAALYEATHRLKSGAGELKITLGGGGPKISNAGALTTTTLGKLGDGQRGPAAEVDSQVQVTAISEKEEPAPAKPTTPVHITAQCGDDGEPGTNSCHDNDLAQNGVLLFKLTYDGTATNERNSWVSNTRKEKTVSTSPADLLKDVHTAAHNALNALRDRTELLGCEADINNYDTTAADANFNLLVTKTIAGDPTAEHGQEAKGTALQNLITEGYGAQGAQFQKQVWTALDQTTAYAIKGKTETQTPIGQLADLLQISQATARTIVHNLAADEKPTTSAKKTEKEECGTKAGDACKGDCVMVDGVCQAIKKAEEKEEKNDKKEEKCTGKKQGECEKDSGCKWEGETCKDSSILVNKKLALSMAATFWGLIEFQLSRFLSIFP